MGPLGLRGLELRGLELARVKRAVGGRGAEGCLG